MWSPNDGTCWSCSESVENGYRLDFYLVARAKEIAGPYLSSPLCYPCFRTLSGVMGEQGKGALRAASSA